MSVDTAQGLFVTPLTVAHQAPLSMGVSRQEHKDPWPRDQTWVSRIAGGFFTVYTTRDALSIFIYQVNEYLFIIDTCESLVAQMVKNLP